MQQKRYIRLQVTILAVLYVAFLVVILTVFKQQYLHFHDQIFRRSQTNLEVLHAVKKMEVSLAIYERAYTNYLENGGKKWLDHLEEARKVIKEQLDYLEKYNFRQIDDWVVVKEFTPKDAKEQLESVLEGYQEGYFDSDHFQRIFYLFSYNLEKYLTDTAVDVKKSDDESAEIKIDEATAQLFSLLTDSISQMRSIYTGLFWDHAAMTNRIYDAQSYRFFMGIIIGAALLFFFAMAIFFQMFSFTRRFLSRQERLVMLGAQDMVTGLFNTDAAKLLVSRENERAKRTGHVNTVILLRFGPLDAIRAHFGPLFADKYMIRCLELVQKYLRPGESVYLVGPGEILISFIGCNQKWLHKKGDKLIKAFKKMRFARPLAKVSLVQTVEWGAAEAGRHGATFDELMAYARNRYSDNLKELFHFTDAAVVANQTSPEAVEELKEKHDDTAAQEPLAEIPDIPAIASMPKPEVEEPLADEIIPAASEVTQHAFTQNPLQDHFQSAESNVLPPIAHTEPEPVGEAETTAPDENGISAEGESQPRHEHQHEHEEEVTLDGIAPLEEMPDTVAALFQDEAQAVPESDNQPVAAGTVFEQMSQEVSAPEHPNEGVAEATNSNDAVTVSEFEVVDKSGEDVIMVDFDREKSDLAERFRRRIKGQGK